VAALLILTGTIQMVMEMAHMEIMALDIISRINPIVDMVSITNMAVAVMVGMDMIN
jgi:hypothetical protein